jgi:hypothetical protein
LAQHGGNGLTRPVVTGGAESPGGDNDIGGGPTLAKLLRDGSGGVGDSDVALEGHSAAAELCANKQKMPVGGQPEQQFVAERDEFIAHFRDGFSGYTGVEGRNHTCGRGN